MRAKNLIWIIAILFLVALAMNTNAAYIKAELINKSNGLVTNLSYDIIGNSYIDTGVNPDTLLRLWADTPQELKSPTEKDPPDINFGYYVATVYSDKDQSNFLNLHSIPKTLGYTVGTNYTIQTNGTHYYRDTNLLWASDRAIYPAYLYTVISTDDALFEASDTFIEVSPQTDGWLVGGQGIVNEYNSSTECCFYIDHYVTSISDPALCADDPDSLGSGGVLWNFAGCTAQTGTFCINDSTATPCLIITTPGHENWDNQSYNLTVLGGTSHINITVEDAFYPSSDFTSYSAVPKDEDFLVVEVRDIYNNKLGANISSLDELITIGTGNYEGLVTIYVNAIPILQAEVNSSLRPPIVTLVNPPDTSLLTNTSVTFNFNVSDNLNTTNCTLYLNSSGSWQANTTIYDDDIIESGTNEINVSGFSEGNHFWNVVCFDNDSLQGWSPLNFTFSIDSIPPNITIVYPANNTNISSGSGQTQINISTDELATCKYNTTNPNFNFETEGTVLSSTDFVNHSFILTGLSDGNYYDIYYICNDSLGNINPSAVHHRFGVAADNDPPAWYNNLSYPSPATYSDLGSYELNITWIDDIAVSDVFLEFNGTNYSYLSSQVQRLGDEYYIIFTNLPASSYEYTWYANDTSGNLNTTGPITFTISRGTSDVNLSLNGLISDITVESGDFVSILGDLVNPALGYIEVYENTALLSSGQNPRLINKQYITPSLYNITVIYPQTQNYTDSFETLNITVEDTSAPNISIITPLDSDIVGWEVFLLSNVTDLNLDSVWYEVWNLSDSTNVIASGYLDTYSSDLYNSTLATNSYWPYNVNESDSTNLTFIVYANDSSGNNANSSTFWTLDNTRPNIQHITPPQDGAFYNSGFNLNIYLSNTLLNYTSYNITNESGDVVQFNSTFISSTQYIWTNPVNTLSLPDGNYTLSTYAEDYIGNNRTKSTWFYVDNTPPYDGNWIPPTPENNTYTNIQSHSFNMTCNESFVDTVWLIINGIPNYGEDGSKGIDYWWNYGGMGQGTYTYTGYCNDSAGNEIQTETRVLNIDLSAPAWYNNISYPESATYTSNQNYEFNVSWVDNMQLDTVIIESNFSGSITNTTVLTSYGSEFYYSTMDLSAGNYYWKEYANDSAGNINETDSWIYVVSKSPAVCTLSFSPNSPANYADGGVNATCTCSNTESVPILYRNGASVPLENQVNTSLSAGTYFFECNSSETENYTAGSDSSLYTINKAPSEINLLLNGSDSDYDINLSNHVNISSYLIVPTQGHIELFNNGTKILYGDSPQETILTFNVPGIYNITAYYNETENYSSSEEYHNINVAVDNSPPYWWNNITYPEPAIYVPNQIYEFNISWADNLGLDEVTLELDSLTNYTFTSGDLERLGNEFFINFTDLQAGTIIYNWYANDTSGNLNSTGPLVYTISQNQTSCNLYLDPSSPSEYEAGGVNATCICDSPESPSNLYRNDTLINSENKLNISVAAGNYNYVCNVSSSNNYSSAQDSSLYIITKTISEINLSLNGTDSSLAIFEGDDINITAHLVKPLSDNITLYENDSLLSEGISPLSINKTYTSYGNYLLNASYTGNENYTFAEETHILSVQETPSPLVDLLFPANGTITSNTSLQFICNASSVSGLTNITLWHNYDGTWKENQTIEVSGTYNETAFNISDLSYSTITWNCLATDTLKKSSFAIDNYTVTITPSEYWETFTEPFGLFEPLCCNGGNITTGEACITGNFYNSETYEGDYYCDSSKSVEPQVPHIMYFNFTGLHIEASNVMVGCLIETSLGNQFFLNRSGISPMANDTLILNYTLSNNDDVYETPTMNGAPWYIHNCSIYSNTGILLYNEDIMKRIYVHPSREWSDTDLTLALSCEGIDKRFLNNTAYCLQSGGIVGTSKEYLYAVHRNAYVGVEGFCYDGTDDNANSRIDSSDDDCLTWWDSYITPTYVGSNNFSTRSLTAESFTAQDIQTNLNEVSLLTGEKNVRYIWTINTNTSSGNKLEVRIRTGESLRFNSKYNLFIKNLPAEATDVGMTIIGKGLPASSQYVASISSGTFNLACSGNDCKSTSPFDIVVQIPFSSEITGSYTPSFQIVWTDGGDSSASGSVQFGSSGLTNTDENETNNAVGIGSCTDSENNDLDISTDYTYINSLNPYNQISYSRDCADADCNLETGPTLRGETGTCYYRNESLNYPLSCRDLYDNDFNDNYLTDVYGLSNPTYNYTDCHDIDCFRQGGLSTDTSNFPCPAYENNSASWCGDGTNNDWDYVERGNGDGNHSSSNTFPTDTWERIEPNSQKYYHFDRYDIFDCMDPDCDEYDGDIVTAGLQKCEYGTELNCSDNFDNDALQLKDCDLGTPAGGRIFAPSFNEQAEYDCSGYCRDTVVSTESGSNCADRLDNDWDFWISNPSDSIYEGTENTSSGSGIDCRWTSYNPDEDCNLEWMDVSGNSYYAQTGHLNIVQCQLATELNCTDNFDNDIDRDSSNVQSGWAGYSDNYRYYNNAGDCADYDCGFVIDSAGNYVDTVLGNTYACPTNEHTQVNGANAVTTDSWCFDGIDNDLDGLDDCEDPDCAYVYNPSNPAEFCAPYELNASLLKDTDPDTTSPNYCGNLIDDEQSPATDNSAAELFSYNSIGQSISNVADCRDADCYREFGQCAPCADDEYVKWNACFDGLNNDHVAADGTDSADTDCANEIINSRGYNLTNNPLTETSNFGSCMNQYNDDSLSDSFITQPRQECSDTDCYGIIFSPDGRTCPSTVNEAAACNDDFDNDGANGIDCYDSACFGSATCGAMTAFNGNGDQYAPRNTTYNIISGKASIEYTDILRKGNDLYVRFNFLSSAPSTVDYIGSLTYPINTTLFDTLSATCPNCAALGYTLDLGQAAIGIIQINKGTSVSAGDSVLVIIPTKAPFQVSDPYSVNFYVSMASEGSAQSPKQIEIVNDEAPSLGGIKVEPDGGLLTVGDSIYMRGYNFTGLSAGQVHSGQAGWCKIEITGAITQTFDNPNGANEKSCTFESSVTTPGSYTFTLTPFDSTGNEGLTPITKTLTITSVAPKISSPLSRSSNKRVHFTAYNTSFDSFADIFNNRDGTLTAQFQTDSANPYTANSCIATIYDIDMNVLSTQQISATSGSTTTCTVDASLSSLTVDGMYYVTVNATDSQGYTLETQRQTFFICDNLSSSGPSWDCALADFDVDGYTSGIYQPFNFTEAVSILTNYTIGNVTYYETNITNTLVERTCDTCPDVDNTGVDSDGDGIDNACDPVCGDGIVDSPETCEPPNTDYGNDSRCDAFCNYIPPTVITGGGGGGGDVGCTPLWSCSAWSPEPCPPSGLQTRTCVDANFCGTAPPLETRSCYYVAPEEITGRAFSGEAENIGWIAKIAFICQDITEEIETVLDWLREEPGSNSDFTNFEYLIGIDPNAGMNCEVDIETEWLCVGFDYSIYKCTNWDFEKGICRDDDSWKSILNMEPGLQKYHIHLDPGDPGLGIGPSPISKNCGDGSCGYGESCASCPIDCGKCSSLESPLQIETSKIPVKTSTTSLWQKIISWFKGGITGNVVGSCTERWVCDSWSNYDETGYRSRDCRDLNNCGTELNKPKESEYCQYIEYGCSNGVKDQNEIGIDCGGVCPSCLAIPQKIFPWWILLLIAIIVLVLWLIWYITRKENLIKILILISYGQLRKRRYDRIKTLYSWINSLYKEVKPENRRLVRPLIIELYYTLKAVMDIEQLISKGSLQLNSGRLKDAKKSYSELKNIYTNMPDKRKYFVQKKVWNFYQAIVRKIKEK